MLRVLNYLLKGLRIKGMRLLLKLSHINLSKHSALESNFILKLPYDPVCPSVDRLMGLSVCHISSFTSNDPNGVLVDGTSSKKDFIAEKEQKRNIKNMSNKLSFFGLFETDGRTLWHKVVLCPIKSDLQGFIRSKENGIQKMKTLNQEISHRPF